MSVVSWSRQFTITSSLGTLTIPATLLVPDQCGMGIELRNADAPAPGAAGTILGPRFKNGYQIHLVLQLLDTSTNVIAVGSTLQTLYDLLMSHLDAMLDTDGRIEWAVAGGGNDRMLDKVRTLEMPGATGGLPKAFAFTLQSPRPHAMDAPQLTQALVAGTPVTITRLGTAKGMRPVARVNGPVTSFQLKNNTTGLQVSYDGTRPGASALASGHYAEIDFLAETVTLDGSTGFLEEGVVWESSDFWDLVPGTNAVELDGAGGSLLYNTPWS